MIIIGLILNLFGSLFLGSHIIGMERLKRLDQKILDFPRNISFGVLGGVIFIAIRLMLKTKIRDYEWGKKITTQRLDEIFEK